MNDKLEKIQILNETKDAHTVILPLSLITHSKCVLHSFHACRRTVKKAGGTCNIGLNTVYVVYLSCPRFFKQWRFYCHHVMVLYQMNHQQDFHQTGVSLMFYRYQDRISTRICLARYELNIKAPRTRLLNRCVIARIIIIIVEFATILYHDPELQ